jgi:hypothetical protein
MQVRNDDTFFKHNQYQPFMRECKELTDWHQYESYQEMKKFMKGMTPILAIVLTLLFIGIYLWG